MDKQEYREFLEEIKKAYDSGKYEQVAAYADELDFGKLKDPRILEMISDSYDHLGETDNAIDALIAAFSRNKTSKQTAYRISELCIKAGALDDAVEYYEIYRKLAGNNSNALLLKYNIGKAGEVPANELIKVLEVYNSREKDEKWEYELARLYHETGQVQKCVDTCDNICLWYSDGEYVKKALELKFSHTALTREQQVRYEHIMQEYMDPEEMTELSVPEIDEVARQLADEYLGEEQVSGEDDYERQMAATDGRVNRLSKNAPESLQDTMVIPIADIREEINEEAGEPEEEISAEITEAPEDGEAPEEDQDRGTSFEIINEEDTETAPEPEEEKPSNSMTLDELRAMILDGNRKKAQSGIFFTYNEPTEEEIAEEEAQKAARAEARRKAAEEAARKAAEEEAAREAAAAAAREAARLEEEARVEEALRKAEEEAANAEKAKAEQTEAVQAPEFDDISKEIDETTFINRSEVLARLDKEDAGETLDETEAADEAGDAVESETADEPGTADEVGAAREEEQSVRESLGFTAIIDRIADEVGLDEVTAPEPVYDTKEDDDVGATQIFSREELDTALDKKEEQPVYQTPEERLGAAIEQIMDDANSTIERDMEETKNIRIVLPLASANKLGLTSVKLSQYASSVERPELESGIQSGDHHSLAGAPRIIDNVDFSYIPVSSDEDGQLGLNIEFLTFNDEDDVEGQMTIDEVLENYNKKLKLNSAKVLDIESERLRQIQEAVNLTAPVKLPYSMDDLMFDDIEMTDIDGGAEEAEGDVFQFDPENIGVIPSDDELLAAIEAEEAAENEAEEQTAEDADEIPVEETEFVDETEAFLAGATFAAAGIGIDVAGAEFETIEAAEPEAEVELEAEIAEEEVEAEAEVEPEAEPVEEEPAEEELSEAEKAIAAFDMNAEAEPSEDTEIERSIDDELLGLMDEIEQAPVEEEPVEEESVEEEPVEEEPAEEELVEEEPAGKELSEVEKAIAAFDMSAEAEPSEDAEIEKSIDDELFDVMAELSQTEEGVNNDETAEEVLETDAFEEMFGELAAEEEPEIEESDDDYAEYDNEEPSEAVEEIISGPEQKPVAMSSTGYSLPDDMRESMSEFLLIDGMEQQIVDVVGGIIERRRDGDSAAGNLIVTGDIKSGKTFLAIEIIKAVTEELGSRNGKVAKVQAELLNGKNIEKVFEKIGGSDLIIENVGYLEDSTIYDITDVMKSGRFDSMVIIEGNQLAVESIFSSFPEFAQLFENRIDINELSIVQWADVAMDYAREKGYTLDDMAKLALHARINEINVPTARLGYDDIMDIMDDAIAKAEKRGSGRLFAAFKKGEDDLIEMVESDFL